LLFSTSFAIAAASGPYSLSGADGYAAIASLYSLYAFVFYYKPSTI
jgi:hypothetical protein